MSLFGEAGLHPRHDLGQNFLIDLNLLGFLVSRAELDRRDVVLEIGTGTGGLTAFLAEQAGHVVSVEVDSQVHRLAADTLAPFDNVTLLLCDALASKHCFAPAVLEELDRHLQKRSESRLKLVANLPYSIATPVMSNLVASELPWNAMTVTIQWELAERMRARPAGDDYGALSVWLQSQCRIDVLKRLGPQVFWPRPQVDSAIVSVVPDAAAREQLGDRAFFHELLRGAFQQRRKRLRGVLREMYRSQLTAADVDDILRRCEIAEGLRAEQLEIAAFIRLNRQLQGQVSINADQITA